MSGTFTALAVADRAGRPATKMVMAAAIAPWLHAQGFSRLSTKAVTAGRQAQETPEIWRLGVPESVRVKTHKCDACRVVPVLCDAAVPDALDGLIDDE